MNLSELKIGDLVAKIPIIQGGMGVGISLSGLASAVANEGGIGVIATAVCGMNDSKINSDYRESNIRALRTEIRKARKMTSGILGVNIMVALTNFDDMVNSSLEGIDIIFCGAGLPLDLPGYLRNGHKTKLVPIVSSARAARIICKKWLSKYDYLPDALVVEGPKAGGHLGFKMEQINDPDIVLEKTYRTQKVHHGYIEPFAALAMPRPLGPGDAFCQHQHWPAGPLGLPVGFWRRGRQCRGKPVPRLYILWASLGRFDRDQLLRQRHSYCLGGHHGRRAVRGVLAPPAQDVSLVG